MLTDRCDCVVTVARLAIMTRGILRSEYLLCNLPCLAVQGLITLGEVGPWDGCTVHEEIRVDLAPFCRLTTTARLLCIESCNICIDPPVWLVPHQACLYSSKRCNEALTKINPSYPHHPPTVVKSTQQDQAMVNSRPSHSSLLLTIPVKKK